MPFFSTKSILYFSILTVIFLIAYPYIFDEKIFLGGDNANYYTLAKSLASGNGYTTISSPTPLPANHFPPGYPLLMAILIKMGLGSLFSLKVFNGSLLLISSFLTFHISFKLTKNNILSVVLATIVLLNSNILQYSTILMSEMAFMTLTLLSIYLFIINKEHGFKINSPYFYFMLAVVVLSIYTRNQGITLFGAILIFMLINKKYKASLVLFSFCFIALLPWQVRSSNLGGSTYMKQLMRVDPYSADSKPMKYSDWGVRVVLNAERYISKEIPASIFPTITPDYIDPKTGRQSEAPTKDWLLGYLVILLTLLGVWSIKSYRWFFILFFGANLTINFLWPQVWFGIRFFLPMVPLTILFASIGLYSLIQIISRKKLAVLESTKLAYLFILLGLYQISSITDLHQKSNTEHSPNWNNFLITGEWSHENLPQEAVISCRKPGLFYMYSGQKTTRFAYTDQPDLFFEKFDKEGVTHVVIEQLGFSQTSKFLVPMVQKHPEKFKLVHSLNTTPIMSETGEMVTSPKAVWMFEYNSKHGYQGQYKDGVKDGKGKFLFKDGSSIVGTWKNDTIQGYAEQTNKVGETFQGSWVDGKKQGTITIFCKSGDIIETIWNEGTMEPEGYLLDKNKVRVRKIQLF